MRKIISVIFAIVIFPNSGNAQWKEIADFTGSDGTVNIGEYITCIYFLDLPGPPRIGFVGSESELHKTTDGGKSWNSVWGNGGSFDGYYVTDICFKDSMIGWFSILNESGNTGDACYRTTDGGGTWTELPVTNVIYGGEAIFYNNFYNRLLLSELDTGIEESTDLGDTWRVISPIEVGGFSFSNDSMGIATGFINSSIGIIRTTNGGLTWSLLDTIGNCGDQPLTISNTPICFEVDVERIIIRRSDNYGQTWRIIKDFGPNEDSNFNESGPEGTGVIRGDTSRLYIQSDSGMYLSTDQGITWMNDGGPTAAGSVAEWDEKFYCTNGFTIAGMTYANGLVEDGGLWQEILPQSGVAESATANSNNALSVFPNPATSSITIESANGPVSILDPLGRSYTTPQPPPPIESRAGPWKGGGVSIDISMLPSGVYFVSDGYSRSKFVKE